MVRRVVLIATMLVSARALAMPAPPAPGSLAVPSSTAKTLELLEAKLRFECDGALECSFRATYRVRNPGATEVRQALAAQTASEEDEITLDGQAVDRAVSPDESAALKHVPIDHHRRGLVVRPIAIVVAPGATRTLVVAGHVKVYSSTYFEMLMFPANSARHVVLANHDPEQRYWLRYSLDGLRTWSGTPRVELELVVPKHFEVDAPPLAKVAGTTLYRATVTEPPPAGEVNVAIHVAPPLVYPGGVLVGIGGSTGDASGFRVRVGGELAVASWLFGSLVFESNPGTRSFIVPAVHAALPMLTIIPSLGAGLGVPVQITSATRVGARLQLDAHLGPLGFLTTIDWYPKTSSEPSLVQPSFMFQVGL